MEALEFFREAINSLGFPIAMVGYFIWDKTKVTNQLTNAINNNNVILEKLLVKLGMEDMSHHE